jgi:hypothetical protein
MKARFTRPAALTAPAPAAPGAGRTDGQTFQMSANTRAKFAPITFSATVGG